MAEAWFIRVEGKEYGPADVETLHEWRAEGRVLRPGRTLTVCRADVFGISGGDSRLVATMLSTIIIRPLTDVPAS